MRAELEAIVGAAALDERPVRDMWPAALMSERGGQAARRVLVARPANRQHVVAILRLAAANGFAVTPLGGGTGVCGAIGPEPGELVLDMGAFDRILDIDEVNLVCRAESGVNGLELENKLGERGLTLGHFPSSLPGTTVGGLISTRSTGQQSTFYGGIENMVLGLAVVLPDGTFATPRPGPRSALGPALHELWLGAEGALGVILGADLRVHRKPPAVVGRGYAFPSLNDGLEAMRQVMQSGIRPFVMRLYDPEDTAFSAIDADDGWCALVIANAGLEDIAAAESAAVREIVKGARDLGEGPWERWQRHRFDLSAERLTTLLAAPGAYLDTIELAARWTVLGELHARVKAALSQGGIALCHFSHAYEQGCCAYFTFGGSADDEESARAAYHRAWEATMTAALEAGATITHHHGTGQARARWIASEMGGWMTAWRAVRSAIDPGGVMNPRAVGGAR